MTRFEFALGLSLLAVASAGCGEPTLEEACESYCEAAQAADCGDLPFECAAGCGSLEDSLEAAGLGPCLEQYTALMACAADGTFQCMDGFTIPNAEGCTSEALDVAQCLDDNEPQPPG